MMYKKTRKKLGKPRLFSLQSDGEYILKLNLNVSKKGAKNKYGLDSKNIDGGNYYETSKILWSDM